MKKTSLTEHKFTVKPDKDGKITIALPPGHQLIALEISNQKPKKRKKSTQLNALEKGIIISPDSYEIEADETIYSIKTENLQHYLLFWDKIHCTISKLNNRNPALNSPGIELLKSENIFKELYWNSLGFEDPISAAQHAQQMEFFSNQDENWTLGECGPVFIASPNQPLQDALDLDLQLINAFDLPSVNIRIEEILEFKNKRKSELIRLRAELTNIRDRILLSPTPVLARNQAFFQLQETIKDLNKCSRESFRERIVKSISISLNAQSVISAIRSGAITGTVSGSLGLAVAAGALDLGSSAIQLSISKKSRQQLSGKIKDYQYIFDSYILLNRKR